MLFSNTRNDRRVRLFCGESPVPFLLDPSGQCGLQVGEGQFTGDEELGRYRRASRGIWRKTIDLIPDMR